MLDRNLRNRRLEALKGLSPIGLKFAFNLDGNTARTEFSLDSHYERTPGCIHEGIIAFIMDVGMGWISRHGAGVNSVTASLEITYHTVALVGEPLVMTSCITKNTRRLLEVAARIEGRDGKPIAEGTCLQYIMGHNSDYIPDH